MPTDQRDRERAAIHRHGPRDEWGTALKRWVDGETEACGYPFTMDLADAFAVVREEARREALEEAAGVVAAQRVGAERSRWGAAGLPLPSAAHDGAIQAYRDAEERIRALAARTK